VTHSSACNSCFCKFDGESCPQEQRDELAHVVRESAESGSQLDQQYQDHVAKMHQRMENMEEDRSLCQRLASSMEDQAGFFSATSSHMIDTAAGSTCARNIERRAKQEAKEQGWKGRKSEKEKTIEHEVGTALDDRRSIVQDKNVHDRYQEANKIITHAEHSQGNVSGFQNGSASMKDDSLTVDDLKSGSTLAGHSDERKASTDGTDFGVNEDGSHRKSAGWLDEAFAEFDSSSAAGRSSHIQTAKTQVRRHVEHPPFHLSL
jgi:hypothetical protein